MKRPSCVLWEYEKKKKIKLRTFKSSEHISENGDGPYVIHRRGGSN